MIESVFKTGNNFYPQVFSEECKYVVKEKKMSTYIIDNVKISSDSNEENSDKKIVTKKILMKITLMKKILINKI